MASEAQKRRAAKQRAQQKQQEQASVKATDHLPEGEGLQTIAGAAVKVEGEIVEGGEGFGAVTTDVDEEGVRGAHVQVVEKQQVKPRGMTPGLLVSDEAAFSEKLEGDVPGILKPNPDQPLTDEEKLAAAIAKQDEQRRTVPWTKLDKYLEVMNPNRITTLKEIETQHKSMRNIIISLVADEKDEAVARENVRRLVEKYIEHSDGALGIMRVARAFDEVNMSVEQRAELETLLSTFVDLAKYGHNIIMDWEVFKRRINPRYAEKVMTRIVSALNIAVD